MACGFKKNHTLNATRETGEQPLESISSDDPYECDRVLEGVRFFAQTRLFVCLET
jgi:hypothetical protein